MLVNNAGVGGNAAVEECPPTMDLDVMNINLCGAVRCQQAVLPRMRERRLRSIVNITSVTGRIASIGQSPYVTSKWAFEGLSEELAHEVASFGIGSRSSSPASPSRRSSPRTSTLPNHRGYDAHLRPMFQMYAAGIANATDPFEVAT